uniref:Uncharacterized protein n=1 Tax=Chelydra serpentina TaxID=8475 RepID=A0A8C3RL25_CHESE
TSSGVQQFRELTCSLCLDYFQDPVSLDCGHNFCQACISVWWEGLKTDFCCPECRETFSQRNFKRNRQLRNIVEASRTLRMEFTNEPEVRRVCEKHNEVLKVFCQEDQTPICMVCHLSRDHKDHTVVPIEEAAQDYKVIQGMRITMRCLDRGHLVSLQSTRISSPLPRETGKGSESLPWIDRLALSLRHLSPESEFHLHLEGGDSLIRSPAGTGSVPDTIRPSHRAELLNVTLDPDTAHPELIVSEDRKSVRRGDTWQALPNSPERFDTKLCMLGCEGFTSGRHCWEVEAMGLCAVGVARESVSRKGKISFSPKEGVWAVEWSGDQWCRAPVTSLFLIKAPSRIRNLPVLPSWIQETLWSVSSQFPAHTVSLRCPVDHLCCMERRKNSHEK